MGIKIVIGGDNSFLNSVISLALKVYLKDNVSSYEKYLSYFKKCPEAFIFAVDDESNELIGYTINLPLKNDYFFKTVSPDYTESDLDDDKILPFQYGTNYIYMFSIVTDPHHSNRVGILKAISHATRDQFNEFAKRGIYITQASALALSDSGIKLCEGMKMRLMGSNKKGFVYWNREFHKILITEETKETVLRTFILNRKMRRSNESEDSGKN